MVVEEVMTRNPETADAKLPIGDALRKLREVDARHLPVTSDGDLVGILSDRDLRGFLSELSSDSEVEAARHRLREPVSSLMSGDVVSVSPETDLGEAVDVLLDQRIGAVPVVDSGSGDVVGIVSYVDLLRAARDTF